MEENLIRELIIKAQKNGRDVLTDIEGLVLIDYLGIQAPKYSFVNSPEEIAKIDLFSGEKTVIKVVSPEILHKTEVGGVEVVRNNKIDIAEAVIRMQSRFSENIVNGYTINEYIQYQQRLGFEMILGFRYTPDFGPVVSFGPGGIYTEFLAKTFKTGSANSFFNPATADRFLIEKVLRENAIIKILSGGLRNTKPVIDSSRIVDIIESFIEKSVLFYDAGITEFEINPLVITLEQDNVARLVALDVLVKLDSFERQKNYLIKTDKFLINRLQLSRPTSKINNLLKPKSAAIIGVSEKIINNGRIILDNLVQNGFDKNHLYIIKAGVEKIGECRCFPNIMSLPEKVDLFVIVIPANQTAECLSELIEQNKAESVIVIPGGLEEKAGTKDIVQKMHLSLEQARKTNKGPLINGGNCLGIRSIPGKYNTLFIPEYKLPMPQGKVAPLAVISQSGAFAICRISKHPEINPKYIITCGNQMDLTIGDYLEYLKDDKEINIFAVYVEGFKPLDGQKLLNAARAIIDSGRAIIFYRAGRTEAGAMASASHTASIAGDYAVTDALLSQIGVFVANTLDEFDDAITLFTLFLDKEMKGRRLGAVSNAGFECVAFADNLGKLRLANFSDSTNMLLNKAFEEASISGIVDVHNPVDLTPMADDKAYYETFRIVMEDDSVDCGIVGIVPLTVRMNTLEKNQNVHDEDVSREDSIAHRYGILNKAINKPWVAVVDVGSLYDPLCRELSNQGIPVFRTADRALKMLNIWMDSMPVSR